ncbi:MAG TPA: exosortase E/protease, VPEID-CTERM system [Steroidobacteraceae bacterium]|jgi:exosortase E/protease (VPEID-CTERM system)|nr:exosortase E/protease, VPEID-CTERM system [Steroidobacteraceae bacterium]
MPTSATDQQRVSERMSLAARLAIVVLVLVAEKFLLNFFVDFDSAQAATGLGATVRITQHWGFRFAVTLAASLALFSYVRSDARLVQINAAARAIPLRPAWLLCHGALLLPLVALSYFLYGVRGAPAPFAALVALWVLVAVAAVLTLLAGMGPWRVWRAAARALGVLWFYAGAAAAVAAFAMQWSQKLWEPTARVTFEIVRRLLAPMIPSLQSDASTLILSTDRFSVQIAEVCSGLEGVGLMLAFCCAWLVCFRKEYIFPRALALIPAALLLVFALNVLRVAALVLIGDAGHPDIAVYGFHSQAGWIAFNCAAGAIAFASRRSAWLNRTATRSVAHDGDNPTAAYVLPLLAVLAAGMLARAASSGFETLYATRLVAGGLVLWFCWPKLTGLDWRFSWRGPAAGVAVFVLWLCASYLLVPASTIPDTLAAMSSPQRWLWIAARVAASLIIVPIAEELAYRGYLLRRLTAADFESVRFRAVGGWSLLLSSLAFGLAHGAMWLPGIAAGAIYGALVMRTERIGEALVAHVTANGLIAACVLLAGQWQLW